jgi:hypothetical protein
MAISDEFKFLVECCRLSFARSDGLPILDPAGSLNWAGFLRLARFHRVQGLVANALSSFADMVPNEVVVDIAADARAIAAHNLLLTLESERLLTAFAEAGTPLLFLKGLPLGVLAYGSPALKSAIDVDLLIDPADLGTAAKLMREAGYGFVIPRPSRDDRRLHNWHRIAKESVWVKGTPKSQIDLHTRTADNRRLIPRIDVHSPRQYVRFGGKLDLPTLADDELFAYLAVHGASSAWFRLKWISDFAALLDGRSSDELLHRYRCSQELGAGRAAGQALLLANELFGTLASTPALADELRRDRVIVSLYRTALKLLTSGAKEPTHHRFGTVPIHRSQFQLLPGMSFKLLELSHQAMRMLTRIS